MVYLFLSPHCLYICILHGPRLIRSLILTLSFNHHFYSGEITLFTRRTFIPVHHIQRTLQQTY